MSTQQRQRLGVLTRSFGLKGGIHLALDSIAVPTVATPCAAWIGFSESFLEQRQLVRCEDHSGQLICYFDGVVDRNAAEELADRALYIDPAMLSYKDPLSDARLVGYGVRDEEGRDLGTIADIIGTRAQYVWSIRVDEREWMMPAVDEFVREIKADERLVVVRPIPGMFDDDGEDDERPTE